MPSFLMQKIVYLNTALGMARLQILSCQHVRLGNLGSEMVEEFQGFAWFARKLIV